MSHFTEQGPLHLTLRKFKTYMTKLAPFTFFVLGLRSNFKAIEFINVQWIYIKPIHVGNVV